MEHVRIRDDDPAENQAAPLIQADPTPNVREVDAEYPLSWQAGKSRSLKSSPPRSKQLFRGFESPSISRIALLTLLCSITYPAFYALTFVAKDRSLFLVRLIVSVWCSGVGFALGYVLLRNGAQYLEAASEFTSIAYRCFLESYFNQPGRP